jgi:hypothetical protein
MKEKTALLIGDGASLEQWREYCVFNHFDYRIGTHLHTDDPDMEYDAFMLDKLSDTGFILEQDQHIQERAYTTVHISQRSGIQTISSKSYFDLLPTLQLRLALDWGAEHIVTVAWDWMNLSPRKFYSPAYERWKGRQEYRLDRQYLEHKRVKMRLNMTPPYKRFKTVRHLGLRHMEPFDRLQQGNLV